MLRQAIILLLLVVFVHLSTQKEVQTASPSFLCEQLGVPYPQGCSGFAADALDKPFKTTRGYTFDDNINDYNLPSGTLVGFPGHVAFLYDDFCGGRYCKFIDVNGPGGTVRCLNSYGRAVYIAYY